MAKQEVFTLDAYNSEAEESVDENSRYAVTVYDTQDEAESQAKEWADDMATWLESGRVTISIAVGEYRLQSGDIYGDPTLFDLFVVTPGKVERVGENAEAQS